MFWPWPQSEQYNPNVQPSKNNQAATVGPRGAPAEADRKTESMKAAPRHLHASHGDS